MEATLTLQEAGERLGVDDADLNRLIRIGALPEARLVDRPGGRVWVVPEEGLSLIADRNGWTIDLRDGAREPAGQAAQATPADDAGTADGTAGAGHGEAAEAPVADRAAGAVIEAISHQVPDPDDPAELLALRAAADDEAPGSHTPVPSPGAVAPAGAQPAPVDTRVVARTAADAIDMTLLDRLLAAHEDRVSAQVREQEARHALAALNATHDRTTGELDIERRERMATAERYREERRARAVADAKVAELRDRVLREMALAEAEKAARAEALDRSRKAEREAANAVALLGWRGRRRFRRLARQDG